jgi:hypothetical protein
MSYGANFPDLNRRAANYVDKILRGAADYDRLAERAEARAKGAQSD